MAPIDDLKEVIKKSPASSADELADKLDISEEEAANLQLHVEDEDKTVEAGEINAEEDISPSEKVNSSQESEEDTNQVETGEEAKNEQEDDSKQKLNQVEEIGEENEVSDEEPEDKRGETEEKEDEGEADTESDHQDQEETLDVKEETLERAKNIKIDEEKEELIGEEDEETDDDSGEKENNEEIEDEETAEDHEEIDEDSLVDEEEAVHIDSQKVEVHGDDEEDEEDGDSKEEFQRRIEEHKSSFESLQENLKQVIIGQDDVVERVVISLMCDGNILLEGVPGLGKSLLVESLGRSVEGAAYNRIQFVPDMLPSDILGQRVYNQKKGEFRINKGPVFTNFLLADEINRAPPKTQAAMMEVMQEKKVSIEKKDFQLDPPFVVLATQNPVEQKGTYPLPEAIMDRFFMKLELNYPDREDENEILLRNSIRENDIFDQLEKVLDAEQILQAQEDVREVHISDDVRDYITNIITTSRGESEKSIEVLKYIDYGPSPRASIWLSLAASAKAILDGRDFAKPEDVKESAKPILRHRIQLNYEGKLKEMSKNQVVDAILNYVEPK